jgi:hypothetical protein
VKFGGCFFKMKATNNEEIKPKGFFVKLDWDEPIQELDDAEAGQLLKNMFNYSFERELMETTKLVKIISMMTVFPTLEFNRDKYQKVVERNRKNGQLGGRKKVENINIEKPKEIPKNPLGISGIHLGSTGLSVSSSELTQKNPEQAKDKEKDTVKVIEKDRSKDRENENNRTIEIPIEISKKGLAKAAEFRNQNKEKFKKLYQMNTDEINNKELLEYHNSVKRLVDNIGWDILYELFIYNSIEELPALIAKYQFEDEENAILYIKMNISNILFKMVK